VRAKHTLTFEAAKIGLALPCAAEYTGRVHVVPIGIPLAVKKLHPPSFCLLSPGKSAWPPPKPTMHKGEAGRVLIFGGSRGLTGAPHLAALGALRAGAGLVTAAAPGLLEPQIKNALPEITTLPLGGKDSWTNAALPDCIKAVCEMPHPSALVLGPGMGRKDAAAEIIAALIREKQRPPLVLDADGLFPLAMEDGRPSPLLARLREDDCITPHPGEAARILGTTSEDVQSARLAGLRALTGMTKAIVVLKGAGTLIGRRRGTVFLSSCDSPSLAVGGSGDVLSGVVAAFMSNIRAKLPVTPEDAIRAVCLGVYVHGKAGEMLDADFPARGALAREIADMLPHVPRG
jgi:NAD(P)H-hydrate epimerase